MLVEALSKKYSVRRMDDNDIPKIYELSVSNPMFFEHCPPFVTLESIAADLKALPPDKDYCDKFYVGFFDGDILVAIMDLILKYPDDETAFIGLFMTAKTFQSRGIGTSIIGGVCGELKANGFKQISLAYAKGNIQSENFWLKNGFKKTGKETEKEGYTAVLMKKEL